MQVYWFANQFVQTCKSTRSRWLTSRKGKIVKVNSPKNGSVNYSPLCPTLYPTKTIVFNQVYKTKDVGIQPQGWSNYSLIFGTGKGTTILITYKLNFLNYKKSTQLERVFLSLFSI